MIDMLRGSLSLRPIPLAFIVGCVVASCYFSPAVPLRAPSMAILVGGFLSGVGAVLCRGDFTTLTVWGLSKPNHLMRPLVAVGTILASFVGTTLIKRALAERCYVSSFDTLPRAEGLAALCALRAFQLSPSAVPSLIGLLLLVTLAASRLPTKRNAAGRAAANLHRGAAHHPDAISFGGVVAALFCGMIYTRGANMSGITGGMFRAALGVAGALPVSPPPWIFYIVATGMLTALNAIALAHVRQPTPAPTHPTPKPNPPLPRTPQSPPRTLKSTTPPPSSRGTRRTWRRASAAPPTPRKCGPTRRWCWAHCCTARACPSAVFPWAASA